jgi:hypothetical protein
VSHLVAHLPATAAQRFAILNENLFGINSGAMNGKDGMMDGRSTKPDLHQK